nr:hypothetical protein BCU41_01080 [Vibrio lentus]PMI83102.1 hypothetical protein BCU36_01370 [Vibrio lentus]PMI86130.1 hypothetical protein BCU35_15945 [Vibrio lentus]
MDGFSLDMRTLNFIIILFSFIYCIGLLFCSLSFTVLAYCYFNSLNSQLKGFLAFPFQYLLLELDR